MMLDPKTRLYSNHDGIRSKKIDFKPQDRRRTATAHQNYWNYGDPPPPAPGVCGAGGGGIEFRAHTGDDESGITSPPLWKSASPPEETAPSYRRSNDHNQQYHLLSPTSRTKAISRGQQELMEIVKSMPESAYELSLQDLVECPKMQHALGRAPAMEDGVCKSEIRDHKQKRKKKKKNSKKVEMSRSTSINSNGPFLLKMFFPTSLGQKKNSITTTTGTYAKVSPRPLVVEGDKSVDKEWWKKRFSVSGRHSDQNGSGRSMGGSSNSSRNRGMENSLFGCWPFHPKKANDTKATKGWLF